MTLIDAIKYVSAKYGQLSRTTMSPLAFVDPETGNPLEKVTQSDIWVDPMAIVLADAVVCESVTDGYVDMDAVRQRLRREVEKLNQLLMVL